MDVDTKDKVVEILGVCGCLDEEVVAYLGDELEKCSSNETGYDASFISQLARVYLDSKEWIEHGTAIRGSRLTPEGEEVLRKLREVRGV